MTSPVATYSFLPWMRQGLSNRIDVATSARGRVSIAVELVGENIQGGEIVTQLTRNVALYGPGDVIGIESRAIVRTEPLAWITNFEPNYLPFVEFYDEDFPWRYTPAKADKRLTPWISLVVLAEGEFKEPRAGGRPLSSIDIADTTLMPPPADLWAWAHVHVQREIVAGDAPNFENADQASEALRAAVEANPDDACSRLMNGRRLSPNTAYHAFVMPTFESGRLAGLGLDPDKSPSALRCAWDTAAAGYAERTNLDPTLYPYYYRWFFRTGATGDFEYLVRKLKPRPIDSRVGVRDVDVQRPGSNVPGITNPPTLKFSGALRAPRSGLSEAEKLEAEAQDKWSAPFPHPFQTALAAFINLADNYQQDGAQLSHRDYADDVRAAAATGEASAPTTLSQIDNDPDPVITPPLYARWHARTQRLLTQRDGTDAPDRQAWLHDLNLDPRWRGAAGLGAQVIQADQENYMAAAWAQVGALPDANRRIRQALTGMAISNVWHSKWFAPLAAADPARLMLLSAPVQLRIVKDGMTVRALASASLTPDGLMSAPLRRAMRPRARLSRQLGFTAAAPPHAVLTRLDAGEIPAVPPKTTPPSLPKIDDTATLANPAAWPAWLEDLAAWLRDLPLWVILLVVLILVLIGFALGVAGAVAMVAVAAALTVLVLQLRAHALQTQSADNLKEESRTPQTVDSLPVSSQFNLSQSPGEAIVPATRGTSDSADAARFKAALKDAYAGEVATREEGRTAPRIALDLKVTAGVIATALQPSRTVPLRTLHDISLPARFKPAQDEAFDEIMNYPVFDTPMYQPLKALASDFFVPNLNLIAPDSITLMETNQKFIESYMVGLNDEFGRELLWREYPTDQRGSPFRQFWDVSVYYDPNATDPEAQKEALRDIPPIHRWGHASLLGTHDNREAPGAPQEEEIVLTVRGELFKKYPNAVVYAHKADWQLKNGEIDLTKERILRVLATGEDLKPPRDKVKTPLYQARASDDIFLFGFDLTVEEARGGPGDQPGDINRAGWFFVIKERPGEPRFGLDDGDAATTLHTWSDASWGHIAPGPYLAASQALSLVEPTDHTQAEYTDQHTQYEEDRQVPWGTGADAASLAYILYQSPVLVAVHAAEMLAKPGAGAAP